MPRFFRFLISLNIILISVLFFISCNDRITDPDITNPGPVVNKIGQTNSFEIAAWNIENFPKTGATVNTVKKIIRDLDIDLIGVQEIASISAFNTLLDSLPGWKGVLSSDQYSSGNYQKTGILYKPAFISISSVKNIFENDWYPFPRPPLMAYVQIKDLNGTPYDFSLIVLHLKAFSGVENENRRRQAIVKLENFISDEISNGADKDFIVLGDWNDRLSDSGSSNVFTPFLNQPEAYTFLSSAYSTAIDHIMITNGSLQEYGSGKTQMVNLNLELTNYASDVSDHIPVVAQFKGFTLSLNK